MALRRLLRELATCGRRLPPVQVSHAPRASALRAARTDFQSRTSPQNVVLTSDTNHLDKTWSEYKEEDDAKAKASRICNNAASGICNNPAWIIGADAASVLTVLLLLVVIALGFLGKFIAAAILSFLCMILTIAPFALWESEYCGTGSTGLGECDRYVSYGFQVFAFVLMLFAISGFGIAHLKGDDA